MGLRGWVCGWVCGNCVRCRHGVGCFVTRHAPPRSGAGRRGAAERAGAPPGVWAVRVALARLCRLLLVWSGAMSHRCARHSSLRPAQWQLCCLATVIRHDHSTMCGTAPCSPAGMCLTAVEHAPLPAPTLALQQVDVHQQQLVVQLLNLGQQPGGRRRRARARSLGRLGCPGQGPATMAAARGGQTACGAGRNKHHCVCVAGCGWIARSERSLWDPPGPFVCARQGGWIGS